jgi:tetratricopeptide (TPR) repeat protein
LKLGCTTCHNPHVHVGPAKRETHYRTACLKCHNPARDQRGCSETLAKRRQTSPPDSCIGCHMPRYRSSDIVHTASTDHRIVRRAGDRPIHEADLDRAALTDFYRDRFPGGDQQAERTLGLGLVKMMNAGLLRPERHGARALRVLESALVEQPQDGELRAGKVEALVLLGRPGEALAEADLALARRPGDWRLLSQAAEAAAAVGQTDQALDYWRRAVALNPFVPASQVSLIDLLSRTRRLDEARTRCLELLRLDPFNVEGRQVWIGFLLREGKKAEARREFAVIRRLRPPDLAQKEKWFEQQLR